MTNNMQAVFERINEIKTKFGLKKPNNQIKQQQNQGKSFQSVLDKNINSINSKTGSNNLTIPQIKKVAKEYAVMNNVPPSLVDAVIKTESSYNPFAVSSKGARGLMQLMPATMKDLGVSNPFNVHENIQGGVSHLKKLLEKYGWDYKKALAAYNAGESAVDKNGDVPPYKETRQYIKKVLNAYLENTK